MTDSATEITDKLIALRRDVHQAALAYGFESLNKNGLCQGYKKWHETTSMGAAIASSVGIITLGRNPHAIRILITSGVFATSSFAFWELTAISQQQYRAVLAKKGIFETMERQLDGAWHDCIDITPDFRLSPNHFGYLRKAEKITRDMQNYFTLVKKEGPPCSKENEQLAADLTLPYATGMRSKQEWLLKKQ